MKSTRKNLGGIVERKDFMEFAIDHKFFHVKQGQLTQNYNCEYSIEELKWKYENYQNELIDLSENRVLFSEGLYLLSGNPKEKVKVWRKVDYEIFELTIKFIKKYKSYCFKLQNTWTQVVIPPPPQNPKSNPQ